MKFGLYLEQNQITEWKEFYINYKKLKSLLKVFKNKYKNRQQKKNKKKSLNKSVLIDQSSIISLLNFQLLNPQEEKNLLEKFGTQLLLELKKVSYFLYEKIEVSYNKLLEIKEQLEYLESNKNLKLLKNSYENAIKEIFKENQLLKSFMELNLKAKEKIQKKFHKFTKELDNEENNEIVKMIIEKIEKYSQSSNLLNSLQTLSLEQTEIEKIFGEYFFDKYSSKAIKILKDYGSQTFFTQNQSFYFGFFLGILLVLTLLCFLIGYHFHIDMDDDAKFKTIFPMFRGYIVFILYFWHLAVNVYVWNLYHINYQLAFGFDDNHYSDVMSICKRAAFFSLLVVLMLLCYMIERTQIPIIYELVSFIPLEFTPLVCWVITFIYLFFPFQEFNYLGRKYLFNLFFESMASITVKNELKHTWFGDQLTSLTGPLRDFEYTTCYYTHYFETVEEKKRLCNNHRTIVLCVNLFPYFVRLLQCIKTIIDNKKLMPDILNCVKYTLSLLVAISSYYSNSIIFFHKTWLIIAVTSSCYSYCWDMKMDYGLLQQGKNYPLRNKLIYEKKYIYYTAMTLNFFGRFAWVLTISPEVVYRFIRPEFFLMIIYLFEAFRRGMWNFFRVELKHIDNCKNFQIGPKIDLPLQKNNEGDFILKDIKLVAIKNQVKKKEVINELENSRIFKNKNQLSRKVSKDFSRDSLHSSYNLVQPIESRKNKEKDPTKRLENYLKYYEKETDKNTGAKKFPLRIKSIEMKNFLKNDSDKK